MMSIMLKRDSNHPFNNAANWKEVEHLKAPGQLSAGKTNHFTFDKVETYAVRMRMKKADGTAGIGLTELTVLGNKVVSSTSSEISTQGRWKGSLNTLIHLRLITYIPSI